MTPPRVAALKRVTPYLATFLVVTILLLVGFLQAHGAQPRPTAGIAVPSGSGGVATPTAAPKSRGTAPTHSPGDPAATATTTAATVPTRTTSATTTGKRSPRVVAWIRDLGLTGGVGSYWEAFIAELAWGRCAELLREVDTAPTDEVDDPTRTLYRAAAQACLAAFHGKRSLWPAADTAVEELSGRSATFNCVDRAVYDLTRTLVKIHRANPDAVLQRGHADDADGAACPRIRSVEPGSGPAAGGYDVRIVGEHLPNPAVIHFGEVTRTVPTSGGRIVVFTVPPLGQYDEVSVWVEGWPFEAMHSPVFTYEPPTSAAPEESHGP